MNTNPHLPDVLARRAERMAGHSIDVDAARARAARMQRNRRVGIGVATALVLAAAVPLTLSLRGADRAEFQPVLPSPTVSATPGTGPVGTELPGTGPQPAAGVLAVDALPQGYPLRISWIDDSGPAPVLHLPVGTAVTLPDPGEEVRAFTRRGDGVVVLQTLNHVIGISGDGKELFREPSTGLSTEGLAIDTDTSVVAWTRSLPTGGGQVRVLNPGTTTPASWGPADERLGSPVAFLVAEQSCAGAQDVCVATVSGPDGPLFVRRDSITPALSDGSSQALLPAVRDVASDIGDAPVLASGTTPEGCSAVYRLDPAHQQGVDPAPEPQATECSVTLDQLAPDWKRVSVTTPSAGEGTAAPVVGMLGVENGRVQWSRTAPTDEMRVGQARWETGTHLVVPVLQDGSWVLVRYDRRGTGQWVSPRVSDPADGSVPLVVETTN